MNSCQSYQQQVVIRPMSYIFYKWLHLSSLFIMILTTGLLMSSALGQAFPEKVRKNLAKLHGSSLFVVLFGGFGLLARAHIDGAFSQGWFLFKLFAWLVFGMTPLFLKKIPKEHQGKLILFYSALTVATVYMVLNKPF